MTRERPHRPPLPTDPFDLPPLPAAFSEALDSALSELAEVLTPGARAAVEAHARLLVAWSGSINLTALRAPEQIALEHVADSLGALPLLRRIGRAADGGEPSVSLLDLGSGAGYPGLPLAVALPARRAVLADSIAKKARFLEVAARAAEAAMTAAGEAPPAIEVRGERVEALGHDRGHRERSDVVTARAVAPLPDLVELAFPLLRPGGHLFAWKRDDGQGSLDREIDRARAAMARLGGDRAAVRVEGVQVEGLLDHRLLVVPKLRTTPRRYARPPAERRRVLLT